MGSAPQTTIYQNACLNDVPILEFPCPPELLDSTKLVLEYLKNHPKIGENKGVQANAQRLLSCIAGIVELSIKYGEHPELVVNNPETHPPPLRSQTRVIWE